MATKTLFHQLRTAIEAVAFTELRPRHTDEEVSPTSERDEMRETGWFPVFRSGSYPQAKITREDVDRTAQDFAERRGRAPIVFDHLNEEDLAPGAKPGGAAGYIIEARSVDDPTQEYAGERLLEVRAKVGMFARWATREGAYRNVSIGLSPVKKGDVKVYQIHHLALLGAAPPAVDGLPEVIFGDSRSETAVMKLSFSEMGDAVSPEHPSLEGSPMSMISFADHKAAVKVLEDQIETFRSQVDTFKKQTEQAVADADAAKADAAAAKADAEASKAALTAAEDKAAVAVEAAREEGRKAGHEAGLVDGQLLYAKQAEEAELKSFCEGLRREGKINDAELAKFPGLLFRLQGEDREALRTSLSARPALPGESTNFGHKPEEVERKEGPSEEKLLSMARELMAKEPTRFSSIMDAYKHVRDERKEGET